MKFLLFLSISLFLLGIGAGNISLPSNSIIAFLVPFLFALPIFVTCVRTWGRKEGIRILIIGSICALTIETFALITGYPYGHFLYASYLLPKLFSTTPLITPLGFLPLFFGVLALVPHLPKKFSPLVTSLTLLLATDVVIDPGAVAMGLWTYEKGGMFYQVPLINFIGWILTGALLYYFWYKKVQRSLPLSGVYSLLFLLSFWTGVVLVKGYALSFFVGALYTIGIFLTLYANLPRTRNTS